MTVVNDHWWLNCMVDGSRPLLYDLSSEDPFRTSVAQTYPEIVHELFSLGVADAGGEFPEYLLKEARDELEVPKWNPLAAQGQTLGYIKGVVGSEDSSSKCNRLAGTRHWRSRSRLRRI